MQNTPINCSSFVMLVHLLVYCKFQTLREYFSPKILPLHHFALIQLYWLTGRKTPSSLLTVVPLHLIVWHAFLKNDNDSSLNPNQTGTESHTLANDQDITWVVDRGHDPRFFFGGMAL